MTKPSRWVIAALCIFLIWKFFLISVLWSDRSIPPEPDDSYIYIAHIYSVVHCPTILCDYPTISLHDQSGGAYLTYRLVFGGISRLLNIPPLTVYYLSFYIGTVCMSFALLMFLRRLTANAKLQAFALGMLALFAGGGSYHGFFWVVPSFFTLALFFIISALMMDGWPKHRMYLAILVPLFVFTHPIAPYLTAACAAYYLLMMAFTRSWRPPLFKNVALILALTIAAFIPQTTMFHQNRFVQPTVVQAPASDPVAPAQEGSPSAEDGPFPPEYRPRFPGWRGFESAYLRWVMPAPIALVPLIWFIAILLFYRQYRMLSWFGASLGISLAALLDPNGQRMLILLWPVTFMLYAWGFWYTGRFLRQYTKTSTRRTVLLGLLTSAWLLFVAMNGIYSYLFAVSSKNRHDLTIDSSFIQYLEQNTTSQDTISYDSKMLRSYSLNTPLITRPLVEASKKSQAKYYVAFDADISGEPHPPILRFLDTLAQLTRSPYVSDHSDRYHTYNPLPNTLAEGQLILDHQAGAVKIYRNTSYP